MDWSRWAQLSTAGQEEMQRQYRAELARERDANLMRWNAMPPWQRARWPELTTAQQRRQHVKSSWR